MRIGYLAAKDARDRRSWSGTQYYMARALERHVGAVCHLGPLEPAWIRAATRAAALEQRLTGVRRSVRHSRLAARAYARAIERRLRRERVDVLFAPAGSALVAELETDLPIAYSSDVTFAQMVDYYPEFTGLSARSIREADALERAAIARSRWLLYPTPWAANAARAIYGASAERVHVLPYGANLEEPPERRDALRERPTDRIRLLFVGVDWRRKGGELLVEAYDRLVAEGVPVEATVCGCVPPPEARRPGIRVVPFLSKGDPAQRRRLGELYLGSDLLFLPSRHECYGIVFCEANAFGLPVVATDTGGVSGIVREGENGHLLPESAGGADYARVIRRLHEDRPALERLRRGSREAYEERLNWDAWGRGVAEALGCRARAGRARPAGPLVSVLIPSYNAGSFLRPAVLSVLSQSYPHLDVEVVDDGSTDGSPESLADLDDPRLRVRRQPNAGKPAVLNACLDRLSGELYALQDADDLSHPRRVERQVDYLLRHPEVAGVFTGHELLIGERAFAPRMRAKDPAECAREIEALGMPAHDPTAMYRVALVGDLRYDPALRLGEGYDYILRVGERHPLAVLGECLYSYRIREESLTRGDPDERIALVRQVALRACERRGIAPPEPPRWQRRARRRARDNNLAGHLIASTVDQRDAGWRAAALRTAAFALRRRPWDPESYKPLAAALAPRALLRPRPVPATRPEATKP